jgi:hypothetical protein
LAADIKFRLLSDDSDITDNSASPHQLTPYALYRGMAVAQEYHEIYAKNEGANELVDPSHMHSAVSYPYAFWRHWRKVTGSAKDGGSTSTVYIDYGSAAGFVNAIGPDAIPDVDNEMAVGRCYDLWSKYQIHTSAGDIGTATFRHSIGGSEPA